MAQHISIKSLKQKVFRKIEKAIKKDFEKLYPCLKTSFKYNFDTKLSDFYKANNKEEVYLCSRYIGKGFIFGSERGDFEIHFDRTKKKINNIYLVA